MSTTIYKSIKECPGPILTCRFDYSPDYSSMIYLFIMILTIFVVIPLTVICCNKLLFEKVFCGKNIGSLCCKKQKKRNSAYGDSSHERSTFGGRQYRYVAQRSLLRKTSTLGGRSNPYNKPRGYLKVDEISLKLKESYIEDEFENSPNKKMLENKLKKAGPREKGVLDKSAVLEQKKESLEFSGVFSPMRKSGMRLDLESTEKKPFRRWDSPGLKGLRGPGSARSKDVSESARKKGNMFNSRSRATGEGKSKVRTIGKFNWKQD
jgi:hypothetical protein